MNYSEIKSAVNLFFSIQKWAEYVSKERFDLAAKVKFDLDDEKVLDRLYGLFNQACRALSLFASETLQEDLEMAVMIAEAAYVEHASSKTMPSPPRLDGYSYKKDCRKYFYTVAGTDKMQEVVINLRDAQNITLLSELLQRPDVKLRSCAEHLGELDIRGQDKKVPYYEGDVVFVYGDPTDRVFYDWYRTDAGVYLATSEGWRKLQYVRGRGYVDKNGEPEFENENRYSEHKISDFGRHCRIVGNIHKELSVLVEPEPAEKKKEDK